MIPETSWPPRIASHIGLPRTMDVYVRRRGVCTCWVHAYCVTVTAPHRTGLEAKDAKQIAAFKNNEKARTGSMLDLTEVRHIVASRLVVGFPGCVANDNDSEPRALYAAQPHH